MIVCILLAAGSASRFGSQKLLAPLADGRLLVEASVANLIAAGAEVVVAVSRRDSVLTDVLESCGCSVVINDQADQGMGTSIAAGVAATPDARGWLIVLGDMPQIRADTFAAVFAALRGGARIAIPVMAGKRGHPVGFSADYLARLRSLTGDNGAREILKADAAVVEEINVEDAGIFADVDTPEDLNR